MSPEDLTPEFARDMYKRAQMRPVNGAYIIAAQFPDRGRCGCIIGAMNANLVGCDDLSNWGLKEVEKNVTAAYDISLEDLRSIIAGFDNGIRSNQLSKSLYLMSEWYQAAWRVGRDLAENGI